jgi:hypothetical protein
MGTRRWAQFLAVSAALSVAPASLAACGGEEGTSVTSAPAAREATPGEPHPDPTPTLHIATFGREGSDGNRRDAEGSLLAYLGAYEGGDWGSACRYLTAETRAQVLALEETGSGVEGRSCGQLLKLVAKGTPGHGNGRYAIDRVSSLRFKEDAGFAIFAGAGGTVYWMPMRIEGGRWKVIATTPTAMH